jgi:glutathione synthase/RimK-type ligase-like ATP-grasp enzyme
MTRVALIGPPDRSEIGRLMIRLEERGAEGVILDSRSEPAVAFGGGRVSACGVDLSGVLGVYVADLGVRSPRGVGADFRASALASSLRHLAAWNALLYHLGRRARVVNPPATHDLHALKPFETFVYGRAGLAVPWTVATTDPGEAVRLPADPPRGWVTKGLVGGYSHTEAVEPPRSVAEATALVAGSARMLQERIEGDNVRAFVLDGRVIGAAEILPLEGAEIDSRRGETRIRRIELPEEAAASATAATKRWGMPFAAVDFLREARSKRFRILECNSAPFFVVFEARAGVDISGRLADYLLGRD